MLHIVLPLLVFATSSASSVEFFDGVPAGASILTDNIHHKLVDEIEFSALVISWTRSFVLVYVNFEYVW